MYFLKSSLQIESLCEIASLKCDFMLNLESHR